MDGFYSSQTRKEKLLHDARGSFRAFINISDKEDSLQLLARQFGVLPLPRVWAAEPWNDEGDGLIFLQPACLFFWTRENG